MKSEYIIIALLITMVPFVVSLEEVRINGWDYNLQKGDIFVRQCYGWGFEKVKEVVKW